MSPYCKKSQSCVRLSRAVQSHAYYSIPTRLKKRCLEVGCLFPTGSPFQWLEIPLLTKRPDMIPRHCRLGREFRTVLIRQALLSGKVLKGIQPIVVNCMGPHSIPSSDGMCYLFWIGDTSILAADQCYPFSSCELFWFCGYRSLLCSFFFLLDLYKPSEANMQRHHMITLLGNGMYCAHSRTAHFILTCRLLCIHTPTCAFEDNTWILFNRHLKKIPLGVFLRKSCSDGLQCLWGS